MIYFFHNEKLPVFLLAAYGKNEKASHKCRAEFDVATGT